MKKAIAILLAMMTISALTPIALAGDSGDVTITATATSDIGLVIFPITWAIGDIAEGGYEGTVSTYYANNTGNQNEDLSVNVTNSTNWHIAAAAGDEAFKLCVDGSGDGGSNVTLNTVEADYQDVFTTVGAETSKTYSIHFWAPTNTDHGGTQQTIKLSWKATAS